MLTLLSCCDVTFLQPDGGVSMNESFRAKVMHKTNVVRAELVAASSLISKSNPYQSTTKRVKFHIPTGRWRDGIFDCCIIPLHSLVFLTYCWPFITLGQVVTRMKVHVCCGNDDRSKIPPRAIFIMLTIVPYYLGGLSNKLFTIGVEVFYADGDVVSILGDTLGMSVLRIILIFGFSVFIWVIHTKTRNQMRRAYSIGNDMSCLGDCCCAFWCGTCSICQMARHTANYHNTHRARCCTPNGLDEEWEDYDFLSVDPNVHPQGSTGAMIV